MAYRAYDVTIRAEDRDEAKAIFEKHDVDEMTCSESINSDGITTITYWVRPYLCEDFEDIVNDLKEAGIQVL